MVTMTNDAALPYPETGGGRTAGHSGTDTSRARALREVASGAVGELQDWVLDELRRAGIDGLTVKDLRDMRPGKHHGSLSSALSALHSSHRIAMLENAYRDRCRIYVHLDSVGGRPTLEKGRKHKGDDEDALSMDYAFGYEAGWSAAATELEKVGLEAISLGVESAPELLALLLEEVRPKD